MRSVLALGLLIALCTSANAARVHRSQPQQVTVRPAPYDPYKVPAYGSPEWERLHRLNTPSYDDPSKRSPGG
jgi:hypothetical protein